MDNIEFLTWFVGCGFTVLFGLILVSWNCLREDIRDVKFQIKGANDDIKSLTAQVANIDKRVYGIERILEMKECCILKSDEKLKKAE